MFHDARSHERQMSKKGIGSRAAADAVDVTLVG
jgi:hypothetical protein